MKTYLFFLLALMISVAPGFAQQHKGPVALFDGKTFKGWEGDTVHTWRIENNSFIGGSLKDTVPHNEFLCTTESVNDFELILQFKLVGTGFVNAGVQFHSQRSANPSYEMIGYQADLGKGYWASLYDESRRNLTLANPTDALINKILKPGEWNDYKIQSKGKRIQIWLNEKQTVDYTETDETIPHTGYIALQVHGGGKVEVAYRNIKLTRF
jgi:hypothetical protein